MRYITNASAKRRLLYLMGAALIAAGFPGCSLVTEPNQRTGLGHTANHLVINEVFTLPLSQYDAYSWIELYNPTDQRIVGLHKWSLVYNVPTKTRAGADTTVTLRSYLDSFTGGIPDTLEAGYLMVLAGDSARLLDHTNLGPGKGIMARFGGYNLVFNGFTVPAFLLAETGQIILEDTSGNAVDVVRYGNFVPAGTDSFPGNHSAGMIPEWSSLSRYAYAYSTGNSANDFYMEQTPTPLWFSEQAHP